MKNQDFFYLACGIYQVLLEVDGKLGSLSLIFKVPNSKVRVNFPLVRTMTHSMPKYVCRLEMQFMTCSK